MDRNWLNTSYISRKMGGTVSQPSGTALHSGPCKYLTAQDTHFSPTPFKYNRTLSSLGSLKSLQSLSSTLDHHWPSLCGGRNPKSNGVTPEAQLQLRVKLCLEDKLNENNIDLLNSYATSYTWVKLVGNLHMLSAELKIERKLRQTYQTKYWVPRHPWNPHFITLLYCFCLLLQLSNDLSCFNSSSQIYYTVLWYDKILLNFTGK